MKNAKPPFGNLPDGGLAVAADVPGGRSQLTKSIFVTSFAGTSRGAAGEAA